MDLGLIAPYGLLVLLAVGWHLRRRQRREQTHSEVHAQNTAAGLNEPASLHPVIDASRCIGSSSCVKACPEGALGMVGGKATLINASACIGHGACHAACPFDAIALVFGTAQRGVDIPLLRPNFETNVPGLFIAGELGGMGLIRKAAEQGRQAMTSIVQRSKATAADPLQLDVVIVGAGPAGLSAGLSATAHQLRHRIIEQESSLGGAIFHYPRQKVAMTAPVKLDLVGKVPMNEISKEKLLAFWLGVTRKFDLAVQFGERMERIERDGDGEGSGFIVHTSRGSLRTPLGVVGHRPPRHATHARRTRRRLGQGQLPPGGPGPIRRSGGAGGGAAVIARWKPPSRWPAPPAHG